MSTFQSSNPALNAQAFTAWRDVPGMELSARQTNVMTVQGAIHTTMILTGLAIASAVGCGVLLGREPGLSLPMWLVSVLGGLVLSLVMCFRPLWARFLAVPYAVLQGGFLAVASAWAMTQMEGTKLGGTMGTGVVYAAAGGTVATLVSMLCLYKLNIVRNTPMFGRIMFISGAGLCVFVIGALLARLIGFDTSILYQNGPIAPAITGVFLVYSAFCFILDFDLIEEGAAQQAPRAMEWFAAFGLLVTIVMVYYYILRLLVQLFGRRD